MTYAFLAVSGLFILAIALNRLSRRRLCALCAGIALTWLGLLIIYKLGRYGDPVLIGLLMGQSIAGLFYLLHRRLPVALRIFALPFILTLTAVGYWLITARLAMAVFGLLALLWAVAWLVFTYRNDPAKKKLADAVIECCEEQ